MNDRGRAWEAVRRALGRLAASAAVQEVQASDFAPPVRPGRADVLAPPPMAGGSREHGWVPAASVRPAAIPEARVGGGESGWQPAARLAGSAAVFAPPLCRPVPVVEAAPCRGESADLLLPAFVVRLPPEFLALPSAPVSVRAAALPAPPAPSALGGWSVPPPKSRLLRLPRVAAPRVHRGSDAVLARMPLLRAGLQPPPGVPLAVAFAGPQARLAEAAQVPPEDVLLLGLYPGVPILAVRRIVVTDAGLLLWLKPEVLRERNGSRRITLLVGRRVSTGKMLQAVL